MFKKFLLITVCSILFAPAFAEDASSNTAISTTTNNTTSTNTTSFETAPASASATPTGWQRIYLGPEVGYSWGGQANLKPSNSTCPAGEACWGMAPQNFSHTIHNSMLYGARIGYHINHFFTADVTYDTRNDYDWQQYAPVINTAADPQPHNRFINSIHNQTVLFNLYVTPNLQWSRMDPYITGGLGWASNRLGNVLSVNTATQELRVRAGDSVDSFAWQVGVGTFYNINTHLFLQAGYRFIDLGKMRTGNHQLSNPPNVLVPRLQDANVYGNEILLGANVRL